jgi:DNA-binding transcriptional regulator YiaG
MNALTMIEKIETNLENLPTPSTSSEKTAKNQKIDNSKKPPCSQMELRQSAVRVSQAEFARLMQVSKTSVTNWVKLGKITLHADGTIDAKQAAASIIEKSTPSKLRAKVFKQITNDAATLQNEIARLNAKVIELESALTEITTDRDEWKRDYWKNHDNVTKFIEQLTIDNDRELPTTKRYRVLVVGSSPKLQIEKKHDKSRIDATKHDDSTRLYEPRTPRHRRIIWRRLRGEKPATYRRLHENGGD